MLTRSVEDTGPREYRNGFRLSCWPVLGGLRFRLDPDTRKDFALSGEWIGRCGKYSNSSRVDIARPSCPNFRPDPAQLMIFRSAASAEDITSVPWLSTGLRHELLLVSARLPRHRPDASRRLNLLADLRSRRESRTFSSHVRGLWVSFYTSRLCGLTR